MRWRRAAGVGLLVLALSAAPGLAQPGATNSPPPGMDPSLAAEPSPLALILSHLPKEDLFNERTYSLLTTVIQTPHTNALLGFINDFHLRPKIFDVENGENEDAVLGLDFRYEKSLANRVINESSPSPMGASVTVKAQGELAVDANKNPNNLLEFNGGLHLFQGIGGIEPSFTTTDAEAIALQEMIFAAARGDEEAEAEAARRMTANLAPQFFWDLQGRGGLETDQEFDNRQYLYGANLSVVFRDWRSDSRWGWFNVLDYPFAFTRWISGEGEFRPSGRTFPSLVAGIDMVHPGDHDMRQAIDADDDPFPRVGLEAAFKTPMLQWGEDWLYASAAFRHFEEINASSRIKAADLDATSYFVVLLDLPYRFNVSYSAGRLPLDQENDQVYALGWSFEF